jgi:putative transposase
MARLPRVVALQVPHHVTQRGNGRQYILTSSQERQLYLELLREFAELHRLSVMGYCLMSNHVHLIAVPQELESLSHTLKQTHGRYAAYWNTLHHSSGHVWQGRFYSCPLDVEHLWLALRYTELNPVRAGLVQSAAEWEWSSAAVHGGQRRSDWLAMEVWRAVWDEERWAAFLHRGETETERVAIRRSTHTGRPLGSSEFVDRLEQTMQRKLRPERAGRRARPREQKAEATLVLS